MVNTGFLKNAYRIDPYKNFKFVVKWGTPPKIVLGVHKVSSLKRTTEVIEHRAGGDNARATRTWGRTKYESITLERGITHDIEFENWANTVTHYDGDTSMQPPGIRRNLLIELRNEKGHTVMRYKIYGCWVSEYTALPDLDANANAIAVESMKLEIDAWARDTELQEPDESAEVPVST